MVGHAELGAGRGQLADAVLSQRGLPSPSARYESDGGMISPSSPSVQVTSVTCAPSAAYLAIVAPVPIDSSSGCACTSSSRLAELMAASLPAAARSAGTGKIMDMTETFPRQEARTRRFTLGVPRAFRVSPDGARVAYLRTRGGDDPVTCLWVLDVGRGTERLIADPRALGGDERDLPPEERARRERVREQAGGIVAYATDADLTVAVFSWSGRVYAVDLAADAEPREVAVPGPVLDPRPDPAGKRLAYVRAGALRVASLADPADDQVLAGAAGVTFGLAEFIAAEEMGRYRGYWWSPDGSALLVARVDETPVNRWYIADPANPDRPPAEAAYPAAGTPNAEVSVLLARLDGSTVEVDTGRDAFPYLVTACWASQHDPLVLVQSRDQRRMRLLSVDAGTGRAEMLHEDTDPTWLEIVPGVPAWTADGRLVWTADREDTRRLLVAAPEALAGAEPVTPPGLQVRGVIDVDGDTVLFQASAEPTEMGLWCYGPGGLSRVGGAAAGSGVETGARAGGTTVVSSRGLDDDGVTVRVYRDDARGSGHRLAGRAPGAAGAAAGPVRRRAAAGPHRGAVPVLAPAGAAQAAGAARPVRRPARAAGAAGPLGLPDRAVVRRAGVRGGHRGRPGHAGPRPGVGARGGRRPGRAGPAGSGGRAG